jgi:hypothetical protein
MAGDGEDIWAHFRDQCFVVFWFGKIIWQDKHSIWNLAIDEVLAPDILGINWSPRTFELASTDVALDPDHQEVAFGFGQLEEVAVLVVKEVKDACYQYDRFPVGAQVFKLLME